MSKELTKEQLAALPPWVVEILARSDWTGCSDVVGDAEFLRLCADLAVALLALEDVARVPRSSCARGIASDVLRKIRGGKDA